jgi:hypothetical protein
VICISSIVQHFCWGQNFASWQPKKEVITTNTKDFFGEKNGPKLPDFEETCFEIIKCRQQVPACGHKNMAGFLKYG